MSLASWWRSLWATPVQGAVNTAPPAAPYVADPSIPHGSVDTLGAATLPGVTFSPTLIRAAFPRCADPAAWADAFTAAARRFPGFNSTGWACILAKANTETGGLTRWDENLYYTSVEQVTRMHGSRAGLSPEALLRNPQRLGDQVYAKWGGYAGRGLGVIQLTGLANQSAFAAGMGMTIDDARAYMLTIPGAAMTAPWYLDHYGATDAANRGDMRAVLAVVAGKRVDQMDGIWAAIHGDKQMGDFERFKAMMDAGI